MFATIFGGSESPWFRNKFSLCRDKCFWLIGSGATGLCVLAISHGLCRMRIAWAAENEEMHLLAIHHYAPSLSMGWLWSVERNKNFLAQQADHACDWMNQLYGKGKREHALTCRVLVNAFWRFTFACPSHGGKVT